MSRELTDTSAHDLHYGFRCRRVIAPSLEAHAGAVPSRRRFSDMSNFGHLSARIPIGRCDRRALVGLQAIREISGLMGFFENVWRHALRQRAVSQRSFWLVTDGSHQPISKSSLARVFRDPFGDKNGGHPLRTFLLGGYQRRSQPH